jgi:MurNAc alpha-1-phosphate uridylyltransferase
MRDIPNVIMLFAAGFGTRMGALTANTPKPLVQVAGRALIDHALTEVEAVTLETKVVNCHYFPEQIKAHFRDQDDITIIEEVGEILETGGGLKNALPLLGDGPVFTMNTDAVWSGENPLNALLKAWNPAKMDALLLCVPKANAIGHEGRGNLHLAQDGQLSYGAGSIYTGLQIVKTAALNEIKQSSFSVKLLWEKYFAENRMYGLEFDGKWCDVGTPEGVKLAEAMLAGGDV